MAAFGSAPSDGNRKPRADVDGVGKVALFDFGVPVRNFGEIADG